MITDCPHCGEPLRDSFDALSHEELYDLAPEKFTQQELWELALEEEQISLSTVRNRVHEMKSRGWVHEMPMSWPKRYIKDGR